jgi:hypothetical protein
MHVVVGEATRLVDPNPKRRDRSYASRHDEMDRRIDVPRQPVKFGCGEATQCSTRTCRQYRCPASLYSGLWAVVQDYHLGADELPSSCPDLGAHRVPAYPEHSELGSRQHAVLRGGKVV